MTREQLEHVLRAAARIANERDVLVIGSQSILGSVSEDRLPDEAVASTEVDVAFFDDPGNTKSDLVDGAIGEMSPFHEMYGYYAQGVSVSTATLPQGWRDRVVIVESGNTAPGRGHCLDPYDCVISKLVAGREKDYAFAGALLREDIIDPTVLGERLDLLEGASPALMRRLRDWLNSCA